MEGIYELNIENPVVVWMDKVGEQLTYEIDITASALV
jgi:hypothetical protein